MRHPSLISGEPPLVPSVVGVPVAVGRAGRRDGTGRPWRSGTPSSSKSRLRHDVGPVALALAVGVLAWLAATLGPPSAPPTMPTSPAVEERWGIRVSHVGVSGDGGLVEVRFVVLDSDKALALMDEENLPVLRAEGTGIVVRSAALMTSHRAVAPGRSSFLLYRNTRRALTPGSFVTIVFGDLELEHVPVE